MKYRTTMQHWDVDYGNAVYHWDTNHEPTTNEVMDYMQEMDADFYQSIYADRDPNDNRTFQEWFDASYRHASENYIGDKDDSYHEFLGTEEIN